MNYRGVEYAVLQTISNGWRWSVKRDPTDKIGNCTTRAIGILRAKKFIDELLRFNERQSNKRADEEPN